MKARIISVGFATAVVVLWTGCLVRLGPAPRPDVTARFATAAALVQAATAQVTPSGAPDSPLRQTTATGIASKDEADAATKLPPPTYPPDWVFSPSGRNWTIHVDASQRAQAATSYSPVPRVGSGLESAPADQVYLLLAVRLANDGKYADNALRLTDIVVSDDGNRRYPLGFLASPVALEAGTEFWFTDGVLSDIKLPGGSSLQANFVFLIPESAAGLTLSFLDLPPITLK
jgi:hypothetical protein